jgi:hypothetical protein
VSAGFYEGRSPDILGVAGSSVVTRVPGGLEVPWPTSTVDPYSLRVPLIFLGDRIESQALTGDIGLNQVAPTLERLLGIERPHPEVRSGRAIDGLARPGEPVDLVVVIVWKGVGSNEVSPSALAESVAGLSERSGSGLAVGEASSGSVPLDPAAVLTTIGTGGLPSEHGITGTFVRNEAGELARAFDPGSPTPIIAALGDDLDHLTGGRARVGLIGANRSDLGLIGGAWYGDRNDDFTAIRSGLRVSLERLVANRFGAGGAPDLLGVTLTGDLRDMRAATLRVVETFMRQIPRVAFAITATGSLADTGPAVPVEGLWRGAGRIAAPAAGGFFIDRKRAEAETVATQQLVEAAAQLAAPGGEPLFSDVFPSFAVRFGGYC